MRIVDIENRWRMPIGALARDLAAQGLSCKDSAKALGASYEAFRQHPMVRAVEFDRSHRRTQISRDRKQEFWSILSSMAGTGMNRTQCAKELGYHKDRLLKSLADNPDKDPFEPYSVALRCFQECGRTIGDLARQFAAEGMTISDAATAVGYKNKGGIAAFRAALEARGIEVEFKPGRTRGAKRAATDVRVTQADSRKIPIKTPWRAATDRRYAIERV